MSILGAFISGQFTILFPVFQGQIIITMWNAKLIKVDLAFNDLPQ
jgi:hypothetical protein